MRLDHLLSKEHAQYGSNEMTLVSKSLRDRMLFNFEGPSFFLRKERKGRASKKAKAGKNTEALEWETTGV